jgi:nucleotide-binding universal stress UspA family protein
MKTILVAIDFSDITKGLVEIARNMALAHGASLHLLHVEPPEPDFVGYEAGPQHVRDQVAQDAVHHFKEENALREQLRSEGIDAHSLVIQGPVVEKLLEQADKLSADLIIVGSHGHGAVYHLLVGSVSEGLLMRANCPVLVVPVRQK